MKIAVNTCYGGFELKKDIAKKYGWNPWSVDRTNPKLIELIEYGINVSADEDAYDGCSPIVVVNIPDEATDWEIIDYDGSEDIIYVLDGKIHYVEDID